MPDLSADLLDALLRIFDAGASPKAVLCTGDLAKAMQLVFIPDV
jgi:hypothetical protein